ncbi:hypothetical protein BDZ97DRAFT_1758695 [Flammula alnicola]|nr:hypothetical protein BDZ97DRAFT_1758695 [Flammula alnicola]
MARLSEPDESPYGQIWAHIRVCVSGVCGILKHPYMGSMHEDIKSGGRENETGTHGHAWSLGTTLVMTLALCKDQKHVGDTRYFAVVIRNGHHGGRRGKEVNGYSAIKLHRSRVNQASWGPSVASARVRVILESTVSPKVLDACTKGPRETCPPSPFD